MIRSSCEWVLISQEEMEDLDLRSEKCIDLLFERQHQRQ